MKKGLIKVFSANMIYMLVVAGINFLVPRFTSIETYAGIKTYTLYVSYAGFLALGFSEGIYLKYGGKSIDNIEAKEFATDFWTMLVFQFIVACTVLGVGILSDNIIILFLAAGVLASNMNEFLKYFYQAVGDFGLYGKSLNLVKIVTFVVYVVLIFVCKCDNYLYFIITGPVVSFFVIVYLSYVLHKKNHFLKYRNISVESFIVNMKTGIALMLGSFSGNLLTGIDRWFVKILFSTTNFAMYSFAVSIENMINSFMSPISVSLYSYFCNEIDNRKICRIKNVSLIWGFVIIAAAFPIDFIIQIFLPQYVEAREIIYILFSAKVFQSVINSIYVNLFKANKQQNRYFAQTTIMLIVAIVLNAFFYCVCKQMIGFAWATMIVAIIWLVINEIKYQEIRFNIKEIVCITVLLGWYFICANQFNTILGCLLYIVMVCIFALIIEREGIIDFVQMFKYKILKKH